MSLSSQSARPPSSHNLTNKTNSDIIFPLEVETSKRSHRDAPASRGKPDNKQHVTKVAVFSGGCQPVYLNSVRKEVHYEYI